MNIVVSNVNTTNATVTWAAAPNETNWEIIIQETELGVPLPSESGIVVTPQPTYTKTDLLANTLYSVYVRLMCSDDLKSGWSAASSSFWTQCLFFDDFEQNFDDTVYGKIPNCWSSITSSTSPYSFVQTVDYNAASPSHCIELYNSNDADADLLFVSPGLASIGANTHLIKCKTRSYGEYTLILGTMTDPLDASTFTALNTYALNDKDYMDFNYTFNTSTTDNFIAFKHGLGSIHVSVFIDDLIWEPIPTVAPVCILDLSVETNPDCGNYPTVFTWSEVPGADFYNLKRVVGVEDICSLVHFFLIDFEEQGAKRAFKQSSFSPTVDI